MNKNKDTFALVLGGSSGLGLASAKKLASVGMSICIVHRDRRADQDRFLKEVEVMQSHGVKVITFNMDALKTETIFEVITQLPENSVKVLLHSIAKGTVKPIYAKEEQSTLNKDDLVITINAMALSWFDWSKALVESNRFASDAKNIAFTSEGNSKAWKYYGAVSAAKATLEALMRQMAISYAPLGVRTNCIQAGMTKTPSFDVIPGSNEIAKFAEKRNPFKRMTLPEDVANAVYLLSREESNWINGTVLKVDGGESIS